MLFTKIFDILNLHLAFKRRVFTHQNYLGVMKGYFGILLRFNLSNLAARLLRLLWRFLCSDKRYIFVKNNNSWLCGLSNIMGGS